MTWKPEIVKPLLKRLVFAAIMLPPLAALTKTPSETKKPAVTAKDTIRIYRKTPAPGVRQPAALKDSGSLFNKRCTGI